MKTNKKAPGILEYALFHRIEFSAILASLLIGSFMVATIAPWTKTNSEIQKISTTK